MEVARKRINVVTIKTGKWQFSVELCTRRHAAFREKAKLTSSLQDVFKRDT